MPASISPSGNFFANAVLGGKNQRGAIGFPIKATNLKAARAFTSRQVLNFLIGWDVGIVVIRHGEKRVAKYILKRNS